MSKLTESQLKSLAAIREAKKAPRKAAGHPATLQKLLDGGFITTNEPTKKIKEVTYSLTAQGKTTLKQIEKAAQKACAGTAPCGTV